MSCFGQCRKGSLTPGEQDARDKTRRIDKQLKNDHLKNTQVMKLLLLGPGESGKSTIFKQVNALYGEGYPDEERLRLRDIVYNNLYLGFQTLVEWSEKLNEKDPSLGTVISADMRAAKEFVKKIDYNDPFTEQIAANLVHLWKDPGMRRTWNSRSKFQMPYHVDYFMERINEISRPSYVPSQQDILRTRARTTGIVELEFTLFDNKFMIMDVGGQRNERKKWIHCFDNVTAVLFVGAISEYDQYLYEDEKTNRLHEAIELFRDVLQIRGFQHTSIILFLNKIDLFQEKLKDVPLTVCFPDYFGSMEYQSACNFISDKFMSTNTRADRKIFTHFTCATDTEMIRKVFESVRESIISRQISQGGDM